MNNLKKLSILIVLVLPLISAETTFYEMNYYVYGQTPTSQNGGGGGHTPPKKCTPFWSCSDWTLCKNNLQTRVCIDLFDCSKENPPSIQSCTLFSDIISRLPRWLEYGCIDLNALDVIINRWKNNYEVSFFQLDRALNRFKLHKGCLI